MRKATTLCWAEFSDASYDSQPKSLIANNFVQNKLCAEGQEQLGARNEILFRAFKGSRIAAKNELTKSSK